MPGHFEGFIAGHESRGVVLIPSRRPIGEAIEGFDPLADLDTGRSARSCAVDSVVWMKNQAMPKTSKKTRTADDIAEMASRGRDVSSYFTNEFTVVRPVRRVSVDLTQGMLRELDE